MQWCIPDRIKHNCLNRILNTKGLLVTSRHFSSDNFSFSSCLFFKSYFADFSVIAHFRKYLDVDIISGSNFFTFNIRKPFLGNLMSYKNWDRSVQPFSRLYWIQTNKSELNIQGYTQEIRLQRRLDEISIVCFLMFMIPCNCKLFSFFVKSINKPLKLYLK